MDIGYEKKIIALEKHLSRYAKRSTESLGRKFYLEEDPFRTPFERDSHRVLHSLPFRRLKHKTQVFFSPKDDHICTRMEHSLHVASISSTICKRLDLNITLAEAIALAHDLGHPPFGHLGEKAMGRIQGEYSRKNKSIKLSSFKHEAQSLRVIDYFKNSLHTPLNLTYEVRDGVVCHWGEPNEQILKPQRKDIKVVDVFAARKQRPATLEGCVVRMADTISYLGRDFEDACMAGLIEPGDLPKDVQNVLGDSNSKIIGTLITDLINNSQVNGGQGKNYLKFSDKVFAAMKKMKVFNYEKIYRRSELLGQEERIYLTLNNLFNYFLGILEDDNKLNHLKEENGSNYPCAVFVDFLKDMDYSSSEIKGQIVSDFIVGMTDNFALNCFEDLFHVKSIV